MKLDLTNINDLEIKQNMIRDYHTEHEFNNVIQPLELCEKRELAYVDIWYIREFVFNIFENAGMGFVTFQIRNVELGEVLPILNKFHCDWVLEGNNNNCASFVFNYRTKGWNDVFSRL